MKEYADWAKDWICNGHLVVECVLWLAILWVASKFGARTTMVYAYERMKECDR